MRTTVKEFIKFIKENPSKFVSLGNDQFSGFKNETYELYFAGNNVFFFGICSIITLKVNGVSIKTNFIEKRELEKISSWWWSNVPASQLGVKDGS